MTKRTIVRTTTETLLILGNSEGPWCPVCGGAMVIREQASLLCGVAMEILIRWVEAGAVHHAGLAAGRSSVCLHSLLVCLENNRPE